MAMEKRKKSVAKRIIKWTGIALLTIILLLVLTPILFKDKIVAIVKEQANENLNAKVEFGDFDLSLISSFPDFRFKIGNLSVAGVDSFATDTLAFIRHLKLDINLKSVLSGGPYKINSIIIDNPRIVAKVLPSGRANWDIAKPSTDTTATESPAEDTAATKFAVSLKEFRIKDAYITYDDQQGKMYAHLDDFDYSLDGDFTQDNFTMSNLIEIAGLTFKMGGIPYASHMKVRVKADLDMDMPNMKFTFKENEIALNELTLGFDGYVLMPDTNVDMDITFQTKRTEFKDILSLIPAVYSREFASVKTSGKLSLDGYAKGRYNASSLPAFGLNLGIANAMFKYPSLPKAVDNINVDIHILNPNGDLDATTVDVNRFHVELAGNPVDLSAKVRTPISDPGITAGLKGLIDLSSVKDVIPLEKGSDLSGIIRSDIAIDGYMSAIEKQEFEKFKASGSLEIDKMDYKSDSLPYPVKLNTMKLVFSTQFVELAAFDALLGKSDIRASGKIENFMPYVFKDDLLKGSFSVMSAMIDLNELVPSSPTETAAPAAEPTAAPTETEPMSVFPVPSNIDFVLNTKVARLLYTDLEIGNLNGNIVVRNQKVDMTNLSMVIIGGNLTINGFYETTNIKKPSVGLTLKLENFDIQKAYAAFPTIRKMAPSAQYAKGTFTATLENFRTTLNEQMEPDLNAVNARGIFKTNKVSMTGVPSLVKLGDALKLEQLKNIEINNLNLNYQIKDGRIHLDPFETKVAGIPTKISGSTGIDQTLDYRYQMEIPRSMLGGPATGAITGLLEKANQKAGTSMALGDKITVVALIKGTVTKPVVETGLKEEAAKAITTVTTQAVNTAIDKANEEAQKILEDARKQVERIKAETQVLAERTRQEGYAQADQLVTQANNPLAKAAAKKGAEVAKKKTDEKVQKMIDESDARCQKILDDAKAKADAKAAEGKR